MRTTLQSTRIEVTPGRPASLDIAITNTSTVIDGISALVVGIDPTWVQLLIPVVSLFPDTTGNLAFRFDVPHSCPAGEHQLVVRVFSTIDPDQVEEHDVCLVVEPVPAAKLELRPSLVNGGATAEMRAVLVNTGNVPIEFAVDAVEPTRALECRVTQPAVRVPPGEERAVPITATGRRPWFGNPVGRTITVTATTPALELTANGRFNQRPRIARGVVTALLLVGIIALWALIFLWVIGVLGRRDTAMKTVGAGFLDGSAKLSIENIAGRVTGRVTADSTGDGLARITVEAIRVGRDGKLGQTSASAATADDGSYVLASLLPGTYRFRFSAAGFAESWCKDLAGSQDIDVNPSAKGRRDPVCNVVMAGQAGSLSVAVKVPDGTAGEAVVTVQQITPAGVAAPPAVTATKQADGTYLATGLATPAPYNVTIGFPGFQSQIVPVTLGGGQQTVLDPSALTATSGVISGTVVDATGAPLGAVTVTLRNGAIERTVVTPTVAGSIGQYQFEGLDTPGSYVITFSLTGYSSSTRALELPAGGSSTGTTVKLIGGQGSLRGTVTASTPSGTNPLGGVVVTASNATFTATTATLTGSVGNGTFSLAGLPTPGIYTVSFAAPGYQTEYVNMNYQVPGQQTVNVVMTPATAQVRGTVLLDGVATGGLRVALSDGDKELATTSSNSPAGAFSVADVPPGAYTLSVWIRYQINGVVQRPSAVLMVRVDAGMVVTQTVSVSSNGP